MKKITLRNLFAGLGEKFGGGHMANASATKKGPGRRHVNGYSKAKEAEIARIAQNMAGVFAGAGLSR